MIGGMPVRRVEKISNLREGKCRRALSGKCRGVVSGVFAAASDGSLGGFTAKAQYGAVSGSGDAFVGTIWFFASAFCAPTRARHPHKSAIPRTFIVIVRLTATAYPIDDV
jgi:hypothetical protein